jgi:hypothetical protein
VAWPSNVSITVDEAAGTWTISSDGLPSHARPAQYLVPKPGTNAATVTLDILQAAPDPTAAVPISWTLPLDPTLAAQPTTMFGPLAMAISGAVINDPYEGDRKTVALAQSFTINGVSFVDSCNGHPNPQRMYHYHGIPLCVASQIDQPGEHSHIIGFAADGFPVYGPQDEGGIEASDATGLDGCSGEFGPTPEFPNGIYHYHLRNVFPYTMTCLSGTPIRTQNARGVSMVLQCLLPTQV